MRFFCVFIFLFVHFLSSAQSSSTFNVADSLYAARNFERAALEYERAIFRAQTPDVVNRALFGRVQSFKQMQQFDKASEEILRIRLFTLSNDKMADYFYEKILCNYLAGAFSEARGAIDEMYLNMPDSSLLSNTLILQVFVYNELKEWYLAQQTAMSFAQSLPSPEKEKLEATIEMLYSKKNFPKLKSEQLSSVFAFIPGLAHIYTGHLAEGSVSLLINSAAFAFGVYQVWHGYYLTGYIIGAGILGATYFGGFNRAAYLLQKHNDEKLRSFNNNVRKKLLDE